MLTNCIAKAKELIETLEYEGLRDGRTLIIGSYAAAEETHDYIPADYCASTTTNIVTLLGSITNYKRLTPSKRRGDVNIVLSTKVRRNRR